MREPTPARPRVLFVDQTGQLGGAELSLLDLVRHHHGEKRVALLADGPLRPRLEASGARVDVVPLSERIGGVSRDAGPLRSLAAVPAAMSVVRRLATLAREVDLLHANTQKAWVLGALAARLARRPIVWHLRDLLTAEHFGASNRRIAVLLANRCAARVIANSQATADAFVDAGGRPALVQVVHNGIDAAPFDAAFSGDSSDAWAAAGVVLPPATPVLALFGRLAKWKGQHVAIAAVASLKASPAGAAPHLVLVGEALFGEQAWAARLRALAAEAGVADRVHFAGFHADVAGLLAASDVVIHASTAPEPFGRVIVEGMLSGRPVVASDAGGAREILEDGVTGRLTPPGDPEALAAAITELLVDRDRAAGLAAAGRADALARFTLPVTLAGVEAVWSELPARRSRVAT